MTSQKQGDNSKPDNVYDLKRHALKQRQSKSQPMNKLGNREYLNKQRW